MLADLSGSEGPGSYAVQDALAGIRPRVTTAVFRQSACSCRCTPCSCSSKAAESPDVLVATAEVALSEIKGATAVYRPKATPNYRTREQKQRVRELMASRRRGPRLGHYDVNHKLTERRTDVGHIAFASVDSSFSDKLSRAKLRRNMRAWNLQAEQKKRTKDKEKGPSSPAKSKRIDKSRRSVQWLRAKASRLLEDNERKKASAAYLSRGQLLRELPAHEMKRQIGRDKIVATSKHQKTVVLFDRNIRKELKRDLCDNFHADLDVKEKSNRIEPFTLAPGRNGAAFDGATGLFLVGDAATSGDQLQLAVSDTMTRPKTRSCMLSSHPRVVPDKLDTDIEPTYSPKYSVVDHSVRGHRFVTFQSQLPREDIAQSYENKDQVIFASDVAATFESLRFSSSHTHVAYDKMQGRQ